MRALGLMSGTSMDGVDAAVLETDGETIAGFGPTAFAAYAAGGPGAAARRPRPLAGRDGLEAVEARVRAAHAAAVAGFDGIELVGFHGQTLAHEPRGRGTHQVGRGDRLARGRAACRWSGTSAPPTSRAAARGRRWCRSSTSPAPAGSAPTAPVAFLNLGGVGNVTWVDPRAAAPEARGALVAFDTGPGNALIDDFLALRLGRAFDEDGAVAAGGPGRRGGAGRARRASLPARRPPKSLDRQDFHGFLDRVARLSTEDGAATLAALTVACVAEAARHFPEPPARWLVCGGGRRNRDADADAGGADRTRRSSRSRRSGSTATCWRRRPSPTSRCGCWRGLPTSAPATTGVRLPVSGGRISHP